MQTHMERCQALLDIRASKSSLLQELHLGVQRHTLLKGLLCKEGVAGQLAVDTPLECHAWNENHVPARTATPPLLYNLNGCLM